MNVVNLTELDSPNRIGSVLTVRWNLLRSIGGRDAGRCAVGRRYAHPSPLDQHHKSGCSFLLAPYDMARLRCLAALALRTKAEQTVDMAKKRTKSDKAQRQAEGLEKKFERRPAQVPKKKAA